MKDLRDAIQRGEVDEIVSYYKTHPRPFHPDSEYLGVTLLGEAIQKNQVEIVDVLLEMGANPDKPTACVARGAQNHIFFTAPLNPDFFELLLKAGANPNVVDKAGKPYLEYLVTAEYPIVPEIVEMFLASGATLTKQVVYDVVEHGLPKTIGVFMNAIAERKIPLTEFPKLVNSAIKRGDSKILDHRLPIERKAEA